MKYSKDNRIVLTLDVGGTNLVFSAIRANEEIVEPVRLPSETKNLSICLERIEEGFKQVNHMVKEKPVAISFAFPGPADYPNGIIIDPPNLPAFHGGVALGPWLEKKFNIPVFINNDGNLFALGEGMNGLLPRINDLLEAKGSQKRFKNLLGVTIGTGFGGGLFINNEILIGDNSCAGEIWVTRHKGADDTFAEEGVSIRAVKRIYAKGIGIDISLSPEPREIYQIAKGEIEGDRAIATKSFLLLGEILGDAIANAITMFDGLVVVGGGLSGAWSLFLPKVVAELNSKIGTVPRLETKAFNLEELVEMDKFLLGKEREIKISGTGETMKYDSLQRIGVGVTKLGTEKAISLGAYAFALEKLDS